MIEQCPSPNHGPRVEGKPVDILLLHYTGMPSAEQALAWLRNPKSQVSCHYFVFEDGRTVQLVPEDRRAWHAGVSSWHGETDINSRSIGIEIANPGHNFGYVEFHEHQIAALVTLCRGILSAGAIPPERVLAHSDVAPLRKEDPGELFPWELFHAAGIGLWVPPVPVEPEQGLMQGARGTEVLALQQKLCRCGYGLAEDGECGPEMVAVVTAFQRHFRPEKVDGIADRSTVGTLDRLLAALPPRP